MKNKMTIYYIYEIPGKKVGCTKDLKRRMQKQKVWDNKNYKILGAANNVDDATWLEKEWQIKLGYPIDKIGTYKQTLINQSKIDYTKINKSWVNNVDWKKTGQNIAKNRPNKKSVIQYDKQGNKIAEFDSIKEASDKTNIKTVDICGTCKGRNKSAGGYIWKYKN